MTYIVEFHKERSICSYQDSKYPLRKLVVEKSFDAALKHIFSKGKNKNCHFFFFSPKSAFDFLVTLGTPLYSFENSTGLSHHISAISLFSPSIPPSLEFWNQNFGEIETHVYSLLCIKQKANENRQCSTENYSVLCHDLNVQEIQKGGDISICITDSLHCPAETNTPL